MTLENKLQNSVRENADTHNVPVVQPVMPETPKTPAGLLIRSWLQSIAPKLLTARAIILPAAQIDALTVLLEERRYSPEMMKAATEWILRGNWQWKKRNVLEMSDFFPTPEQIKEIASQFGLLLLSKADMKNRLQNAYNEGYNAGRQKNTATPESRLLASLLAENLEMRTALSAEKRKTGRLERLQHGLLRSVERLRQQYCPYMFFRVKLDTGEIKEYIEDC